MSWPEHSNRGVTLIDTVVGIALMLVVFVGIAAAFELSVDVVSNNKARAGAIALADERMEYIRSLAYASVGTTGGIPTGTIPQSEAVSLNGVAYTRRTVIEYVDDPKDGLGAADQNGITADYKAVKVDVAWTSRTGTRHVVLVTRVSPAAGLEANPCSGPCGTLLINVVNASSQPLAGASVSIVNASTTPSVNFNTFSNASGTVSLIGAPAGSGYQIVVSDPGYSTAQTYSANAQNTNPNPGNLTISNNQTTSGTFAIDVLGSKTVQTWTQILPGTWSDSFADTSKIASSTNISVASGKASLTSSGSPGEVVSTIITPTYLYSWQSLNILDSQPAGTSIVYHVYDASGTSLVPDTQLPGNSAGLSGSSIDLSGISTTTYTGIKLDAILNGTASTSPYIDSWSVGYTYGPALLPNISFTLQGAKTIGTGPTGASIYKYSQNFSTGASASVLVPSLEWDSYTISINGASTGYDIASACNPQPESLSPGASLTTNLYLAAHTANSLLVDVHSNSSGTLIPNATVHLSLSAYSATSTTDSCGQSFFGGLSSSAYSISVSAAGYTTYSSAAINVSGTSRLSVGL